MHWQRLVGDPVPGQAGDGSWEVRRHGDWFVKFPALEYDLDGPPDLQLVVEHLAYRVYAGYRIKVPAASLVHDGRRLGLASRTVSGPSLGSWLRSRNRDLGQVRTTGMAGDLFAGFFVDVLLANWDVVGLTGNNLIVAADGLYRIDPGGSLTFRAQGGRKDETFGDFPGELTTMCDPRYGGAGEVFGTMTPEEEASAGEVFRAVGWPELRGVLEETHQSALAEAGEVEGRGDELGAAISQEFDLITSRLETRHAAILKVAG
jgi:hypothetical protein